MSTSECRCGYDGWFSPPAHDCPLHGTNPAALRAQASEMLERASAAERRERVAHLRRVADALRVADAHMRKLTGTQDMLAEAARLTRAADLLEGTP